MEILIVVLLILLNGLFSMSEIAVISARKSRLITEAKHGDKSAKSALKLANDPDRFLSTIQIGITLIGILTGVYSGDVLSGDFNEILKNIGVPETISYSLAKTLIIVFVTYLTLIFGELVPKRIGLSTAEKVAKFIARPMHILSLIGSPFVWALSKSTAFIFNVLNIGKYDEKVTEAEIKSMMQVGFEDGEVKEVEQDIVERVFSLGDRTIESIMTYRNEIIWLDPNMSQDEITSIVKNHFHDIYPVAEKSLDNILGIVSLKDLFSSINSDQFDLREAISAPQYFHENMEVYAALDTMRNEKMQYAIVCDEFGGLQGIVTMRDILEGLVGYLPEEHEEPEIIERQDGGWLIDGQCSFYDMLEYFEITDLYTSNEYNTVSGLILAKLEHIPHTGEKIAWNSFTLEIVDMDGARIDKVLVTKRDEEEMAD